MRSQFAQDLTLFKYFIPLNLELQTYINFIIIGILLILFAYKDLKLFIIDFEKLKKYVYKWFE